MKRHRVYTAAAWALLLLVVLAALSLGAVSVSPGRLMAVLAGKVQGPESLIILKIRLPRLIMAGLAGISLALGGTVFQAVFRNPMAEPYILGVSSGAALGASLVAIMGLRLSFLGISALGVGAFAGAGVSVALLYLVFGIGRKSNPVSLLLGGVVLSFFFSSLMSLILSMDRELASSILFWSMGSFTTTSWEKVLFLSPILLFCGAIILSKVNSLNLLTTGEDAAHTLGINVPRTRNLLLVIASFLTAATVSCTGTIGFVGLLVPHAARLLCGANHRKLIPLLIPGGASLLILADLLARTVHPPQEIPVGVITGILGAPLFLFLLKKSTINYRMGE